jgi:hypothetical protein
LNARSTEARNRIHALLRSLPTLPSAKARAAASAELRELLRSYSKWRNQFLVLQSAGRAQVGLRGAMTDQLREINFCRLRVGELAQAFAEEAPSLRSRLLDEPAPDTVKRVSSTAHCLLPAGCTNLGEAVEQIAREVSAEDLHSIDRQVQAMLTEQFATLYHVCMASTNMLKNVEIALEREVARATEQRINATDVAALFLEMFPTSEQAAHKLIAAFDESAPDLPGTRSGPLHGELSLLCVPATPAGEQLMSLARQALPEVPWVFAQGGGEIIIYRESPQTPLAELSQLGPVAQEAYRQMTAVEHFTPHSRLDVSFTRDLAAK